MRSSANWGTVVVAMMMSASVQAVPKALHDPSELTGPIRVVDFEGSAAPSSIADGTTINGITFSAP